MNPLVLDGFWLPAHLRERVLRDATWEHVWLLGGNIAERETPGAVAVRWPRLTAAGWRTLLDGLQPARTVSSGDAPARWQAALDATRAGMNAKTPDFLPTLAVCTGYSPPMLAAALGDGSLVNPGQLGAALGFRPAWSLAAGWQPMPGLAGQVRFFPARALDRLAAGLRGNASLCRPAPPVELALGYAAGNVPGTALLIALLAGLANAAQGAEAPAPAVLVRNSRHEPLFAPWLLSAVEAVDPALVSGIAMLVWDYEDAALQAELMRRAGLMIAAAGDETIASLEARRAQVAPACRFHRHGHKVSFAVIEDPARDAARLAALDSALWDQNGCLSARVHFVAGDARSYAATLAGEMRGLASALPRGATPRRFLHRAFDRYAALATDDSVSLHSRYDDDFAVVLDRRPWDRGQLIAAVNACTGRVIVVRPVGEVLDVPGLLSWLPQANLQSVSVQMGSEKLSKFAAAAGARGVTAVRSLGRAAFPNLAYSWDGWLPIDTGCVRPAGHFTTVEMAPNG